MRRELLRARPRKRFYLILALAALTVGTGMATGFGMFYRVLYVLALTVALSYFWNWLSVAFLVVSVVRKTSRVRVGEPILEEFAVENKGAFTKQALEVEDLTDLPGTTIATAIGLEARGRTRWDTSTVAQKRGIYTLGPVRVSHIDPFGLFSRQRLFGDTQKIVVYPRVHDLPEFEVPAAYLTGDASVLMRTQSVSPQASTVRDYAFGDSLSRIHWNSTAKQGKLMSKEFDHGRAGEVFTIVDLHRDFQAGELSESTDEYAVSIAASLAKRYIQAQLPMGLVAYGEQRHILLAETGVGQFERILDSLAVSKAEGTTSFDVALGREELLWTHRTSLIAVTASPQLEWVVGLGELAKRGVRVVAVLLDSASFGASFDSLALLDRLLLSGVQTHVIRQGDNIATALGRPYAPEIPAAVDFEPAGAAAG